MRNSQGSALAIALSLMVFFSSLGLGALKYSGMQTQSSVNQKLSTQAFWTADAGLQQSMVLNGAQLPTTSFGSTGNYKVDRTISGNTATLISSGVVTLPSFSLTRKLQAVGTVTNLFSKAAISTANSGTTLDLSSGLTIGSFNSSTNSAVSNNITGGITTNGSISTVINSSSITPVYNAGVTLSLVPAPTNITWDSTPCTGGGTWNITGSTTQGTIGGNFKCSSLSLSSSSLPKTSGIPIWHISKKVVLWLTSTGEDVLKSSSLTSIQIDPGGSLTIYAYGLLTFGTVDHTTGNTFSNVILSNKSQSPGQTYPKPSNLIIYSNYVSPVNNGTYCSSSYTGSNKCYAAIEIDNNSSPDFYGLVYAPQGYVYINQGETIYGAIVGSAIKIDQNSKIYYDLAIAADTSLSTFSLTNWTEL